MGEFAVSIEHSEAKSVSALGRLNPMTPRPGALPPGLRYRLVLRALAMPPPLPNPKYATDLYTPLLHITLAKFEEFLGRSASDTTFSYSFLYSIVCLSLVCHICIPCLYHPMTSICRYIYGER